jgi:hypothetical protein
MNRLFVSFDGDDIGRKVGSSILMDDVQALHEISKRIDAAEEAVLRWVQAHGGTMVSKGGDQGVFIIDPSLEPKLAELMQIYQQTAGATVTIGTGLSLSQSGKALIAGKLTGKNTIIRFDENTDQILEDAHAQAGAGDADPNAQKQDEQYLDDMYDQGGDEEPQMGGQEGVDEQDMEPSDAMSEDGSEEVSEDSDDDAQSLVDAAAGDGQENDSEESPMQAPEDSDESPEMSEEGGEESPNMDTEACDCDICTQERNGEVAEEPSDDEESIEIPENESIENQEDPESMVTAAADEEPQDMEPGVNNENSPSDPSIDWESPTGESTPDMQGPSGENMDAQPDGLDPASGELSADQTMQDEVPQDSEMPQQPGDLDVLSDLLSDAGSSDELKSRVAAILEKFKANRDTILSMKDQNPEMYQSIIMMLKHMIDMAKHLAPSAPEDDSEPMGDVPPPNPEEESTPLPKT